MNLLIILLLQMMRHYHAESNIVEAVVPVYDRANLITETYNYHGMLIIIFSQQVSWNEAEIICSAYDARLIVVDVPEKANFLAQIIADSDLVLDDAWIGGRTFQGTWLWTPTLDAIPLHDGNEDFPPWARTPLNTSSQCLSFGQSDHFNPEFIDVDCRLKRPFICENNNKSGIGSGPPVATKWVRASSSSMMVLYHGGLSWSQAVAFCRQNGHRLAVVLDNCTIDILNHAMKHSRPVIERMWIGASNFYQSWLWVPTGELLSSLPGPNNYPPWSLNKSIDTQRSGKCLVLDGKSWKQPVFLDSDCGRKLDFVCEEYSGRVEGSWMPSELRFKHEGRQMILYIQDRTWNSAVEFCQSSGSRLVTLNDGSSVDSVVEAMAEHPRRPKHIWVGGELRNGTWQWISSREIIPPADKTTSFPPWCQWDSDTTASCLNLDRHEHGQPAFYGLACRTKQPFICEIDCRDPGLISHGKWSCGDNLPSLVSQALNRCHLKCEPNHVLVGSNMMECFKRSWLGYGNSTAFPRCLCARWAAHSVTRAVHANSHRGLLFVMDGLEENTNDQRYLAAIQFISGIIRGFPLSKARPFGLISMSQKRSILIPFTQTDSCDVIRKLSDLSKVSSTATKHSLTIDNTMKLAYEEIENHQKGNASLIFYLTDRKYVGSHRKVIKLLKKEGHIIIVLNLTGGVIYDIPVLASKSINSQLHFYGFGEISTFMETAVHITAERWLLTNCSVDPFVPNLNVTGHHMQHEPSVTLNISDMS